MPQIRSKQILGQSPVSPNDLATKEYVDNLFGSGVTSTLKIQDENSDVLTGVTIINFIGSSVSASVGGTRQVNIYIPPASYAPYFNNDGATISNVTTYTRHISAPTTSSYPFKIGDWTAGITGLTIRSSVTNLTYSTPVAFSIDNTSTTFDVVVYDADGSSILTQNSIVLTGNTTITSSNITMTVSGWSTDSDKYKAIISVIINISSILPQGGRFSVSLIHHNNGTDYSFSQNDIFRDSESLTAGISGNLVVYTGSTVVTKQISGVYFYTNGTQWYVNLTGINNLNSRSYPTTKQVYISDTNLFCGIDISIINGVGLTSWTNAHDNAGATYTKIDWTTDQLNYTNWNGTGLNNTYATASVYDWNDSTPVASVNSTNYNYLIDTFYDADSNRHVERFRQENTSGYPRLTSGNTTWDSSANLNTYDGGNGLQVIGDRLVYPQNNFTNYQPFISSQPNYTGLSGDKYYYRKFTGNGNDFYNGKLLFSDYNITESDLDSGIVDIQISTDFSTWYTIRKDFSLYSDGCRAYPDDFNLTLNNQIFFDMYNISPGYSQFIYLKITFTSSASSRYIGGIDIIGDYWI